MTATFSASAGNTTMTFVYTAPTAKVQSVVGDCAEYLFNHGYGTEGATFASLTNQQKLNLVDTYLKQVIIDAANALKSNKAQDAARVTEDAAKYTL